MAKAVYSFACSEDFKEALSVYAAQHRISASEVIRSSVAKVIGYDLSIEPMIDGRRRYGSVEERKENQKKTQKEQRANVRKLLEMFGTEERLRDIAGIEKSLTDKGVDPYGE